MRLIFGFFMERVFQAQPNIESATNTLILLVSREITMYVIIREMVLKLPNWEKMSNTDVDNGVSTSTCLSPWISQVSSER